MKTQANPLKSLKDEIRNISKQLADAEAKSKLGNLRVEQFKKLAKEKQALNLHYKEQLSTLKEDQCKPANAAAQQELYDLQLAIEREDEQAERYYKFFEEQQLQQLALLRAKKHQQVQ